MSNSLSAMPGAFSAGTTVEYTRDYSDYPATEWTLTVYLIGKSTLSKVATADGSSFLVALGATDTDDLAAGNYRWIERASKSGKVYDVASGTVSVSVNPATAAAGDGQSTDEKLLAVVEAALSGNLSSGMASYQVAGRSVIKMSPVELMDLRDRLRQSVKAQRGLGSIGRTVLGSFTARESWPYGNIPPEAGR